jgi:hypothetical protein
VPVRFKNFSPTLISVPYQVWTAPKKEGSITLSMNVEPGDLTPEFDPADPIVQLMLRAHPELRPVVMRTAWQRVLNEIL